MKISITISIIVKIFFYYSITIYNQSQNEILFTQYYIKVQGKKPTIKNTDIIYFCNYSFFV